MIRGGVIVLEVADVSRAVRFYIETLGMKLVEEKPPLAGREESGPAESVIDAGEGFLLALRAGPARLKQGIELRTKVPLAEAISIFEMRGVVFTGSRFEDPDGNAFTLAEA